jgi:uncharacterized membrane protein YqjE
MEPTADKQSSRNRSESGQKDVPGGRLKRLVHRSRRIAGDLTEWLELRGQLFRMEIEEEVERRLNTLIARLMVAALLGATGLFALFTLAIGLGWWLGHPFWGYLIVTLVLTAGSAGIAYARPQFVEYPFAFGVEDESQVSEQ